MRAMFVVMTETESGRTASDEVAARVKESRQRQGWTAARLALRCGEVGAPEITASVLANIESGRPDPVTGQRRRRITLEELLALAAALRTKPERLLYPPAAPEVDSRDLLRWEQSGVLDEVRSGVQSALAAGVPLPAIAEYVRALTVLRVALTRAHEEIERTPEHVLRQWQREATTMHEGEGEDT